MVKIGGTLSAKVIQPAIAEVLQYYENTFDRQGAVGINHNAAKVTYLGIARFVRHTYAAVMYLIAEQPEDFDRKPEFLLVVSPMLRSICEACTLAVIFRADTERKLDLYVEGGLREASELLVQMREKFGADPEWQDSIREQEKSLGRRFELAAIDPKKVGKLRTFPYHGQAIGLYRKNSLASVLSGEDGAFASYLDRWYYKTLSKHAHLSFDGLLALQGGFGAFAPGRGIENEVQTQRSLVAFICLTLMLCAFSELELRFQFGGNGRVKLQYLWTIIGESHPDAKEIYRMRYQGGFGGAQ